MKKNLDEGDLLYKKINVCNEHLTLDDIPQQISVFGNMFQNEKMDEYHSQISQPDLRDCLTALMTDQKNKVALVILGREGEYTSSGYASSLFFWNGHFLIFDAHGQNHKGMPSPKQAALLTFDSIEKCASYLFALGKQLHVEQCSISTLSIQYARQRDADKNKRRRTVEKKQRQRERQKETQKLCSDQEAIEEKKRQATEHKRRYRENQKKVKEEITIEDKR